MDAGNLVDDVAQEVTALHAVVHAPPADNQQAVEFIHAGLQAGAHVFEGVTQVAEFVFTRGGKRAVQFAGGDVFRFGGAQAAKVLTQIQVATLKAKGEAADSEAEQKLYEATKANYDRQTTPFYAAARLWVDAIIDPIDTRKCVSMGIEAANNSIVEKFNVGVLQV